MSEEEARRWIAERFGDEAIIRLDRFAQLVVNENKNQNLIAPSTVPLIWARHIVDSAQLVALAPPIGRWLDIGTGGGFPGVIVALLRHQPMLLVEPRRQRADFLNRAVADLGLAASVEVMMCKVEHVTASVEIISARAVGSVENLLHAALPCAKETTRWLLPRGRTDEDDLRQMRGRWKGLFHMEQSLTDAASSILVCDQVSRR